MLLLEEPTEALRSIPAETNKKDAPHSVWRDCVTGFRPVVPLLTICSILTVEQVFIRLWLDGQPFSGGFGWRLAIAAAWPFLVVPLAVGVPALVSLVIPGQKKKSCKSLCFDEKWIKTNRAGTLRRVPWKSVRRWFLAPAAPGNEEVVTLTVETGRPNKPERHYWSMGLDAREQKQSLLSELEYMRQREHNAAPIIELSRPMPRRPVSFKGLWTHAFAFYLLIHGMPLLGVGLLMNDRHKEPSSISPAGQARMERVMRPLVRGLHISTWKQLRMLFWIPGGLMVSGSIGLAAWSCTRRNREQIEMDRAYDLELAKITASAMPSLP